MVRTVRINGLFHLLINGIYWGEIIHLLTIDPNFLGHPSSSWLGHTVCFFAGVGRV